MNYVKIISLMLALTYAVSSAYTIKGLYGSNLKKSQEIESLKTTVTQIKSDYSKISVSLNRLQRTDSINRDSINKDKQKALKDVSRVEKIAKAKGKTYGRLVNPNFSKSQNKFAETSK